MSCANPVDAAILGDYWLGVLAQAEEEAIEDHVFTCNECEARLREVVALAEGIRTLAREGSLLMVVSSVFLKRVADEGLRVRQYAPPSGAAWLARLLPRTTS